MNKKVCSFPILFALLALLIGTCAVVIEDNLTADEHLIIDLVVNTFGEYGGKVLERITHSESPWKAARAGYSDGIPSHEPIPDENIKSYFQAMNEKYDFSSESGIKHYINDILQ